MDNPSSRDFEAVQNVRERLRLAEETGDASLIADRGAAPMRLVHESTNAGG